MAYTQGRIEGSQSYKYILVCGKHLKAYFQSVTFVSVHISNNALTLKKKIFSMASEPIGTLKSLPNY